MEWRLVFPTAFHWLGYLTKEISAQFDDEPVLQQVIWSGWKLALPLLDLSLHHSLSLSFGYRRLATCSLYLVLREFCQENFWEEGDEKSNECSEWLGSLLKCPGKVAPSLINSELSGAEVEQSNQTALKYIISFLSCNKNFH